MLYARLDETGSAINVDFDDRPTNRAGLPLLRPTLECGQVFADATISLIRGSAAAAPSCVWLTSTRVRVDLSSSTTISPGDQITVRSNAIHPTAVNGQTLLSCSGPGGVHVCASGSVVLLSPLNALRPTAMITTSSHRSLCSDITL